MPASYSQGHDPHPPPSPPHTIRPNKRRRMDLDAHSDSMMDCFHAVSLPGALSVAGGHELSSFAETNLAQQQPPTTGVNFSPGYPSRLSVPMKASQSPTLGAGSFTLETARLLLPPGLSPDDRMRRQASLSQELAHQALNPPVLPPTQVQDLPPKPYVKEFLKIPEDVSDRHRKRIEAANNAIAAEHQSVERERNNQAAKKSRQTRMESLINTRRMLNEKTAECAWFRMKIIILGGDVNEWDMVPESVKEKMAKDIDDQVRAIDSQNADMKKKEDARRRAERIKRRAEMDDDYEGGNDIGDAARIVANQAIAADGFTLQIRMNPEEGFQLVRETNDTKE